MTIDADVMFVNKMPFVISVSQRIVYKTTEWIKNQKAVTLGKALDHVCTFYKKYPFNVQHMNLDLEFKSDKIEKILAEHKCTANWCAAKEHVPRIERKIQTLKGCFRAMRAHLRVYKRLPKVMVKCLVKEVTKFLNVFPTKGIIDSRFSPRMIVQK